DELVALDVLHLGNEADAARIMFVAWIIQALSIGKALRRRGAFGDGGRRIYSGHNSCRKSLLRHLQAPRWAPFLFRGRVTFRRTGCSFRLVDRSHFTKCGRTHHHTDGAALPGATHTNMALCAAGSTHSGLHGSQPASANHSAHAEIRQQCCPISPFLTEFFFAHKSLPQKNMQSRATKL